MPQSKEVHKAYMRARREGSQKVHKEEGSQGIGSQYPAVLVALSDVKTRAKLRAVCQELSHRHLLPEVRYGVNGCTLDIVAEYLTALT